MNKKVLAIALGGVAVWYFFLRKKTATATMLPPQAAVVPTSLPKLAPVVEQVVVVPESQKGYVYPLGIGKDGSKFPFYEGDYVANGQETAILYQGKLRPITAAYAAAYAAGTWERTKILDNIVYSSIPRGPVMDV